MRRKKVRYGLVGAGRIAQAYAQALAESSEAELVAVADVRLEAAKCLAQAARGRGYASYLEMADHESLDAVLVCSPPASHPEICIHFLDRHVPVLCEKPICIDLPSALSILDAAKQAGVLFTMASKFRYVEDVVKARDLLGSGIVGEPIIFENVFASPVKMTQRWNGNPSISGGGVLIDNGTHSVDILRFFLGPLAEVNVTEGRRIQELPVEETVCLLARSMSGVVALVDLSWNFNKDPENYIRIYGTHGTLVVGWRESKYRLFPAEDWISFGTGYNKVHAFRQQVENFSKAIRGEEPLVVTAEDALASVEVIVAAYISLRQRRWVPVMIPGFVAGDLSSHWDAKMDVAP